MVKAEPALLLLVGQLRETLVHGLPVAEVLETRGLAVADSFLHVLGPQVADVFGKVHVDFRHFVAHQEKSDFAERKLEVVLLGILMKLDGPHAKSHFNQDADAVERNAELLRKFRNGDSLLAGAADGFENPHVSEGLCGVEAEGGKCDFLGFELGVRSRNLVLIVVIEHRTLLLFSLFCAQI